MYYEAHGPLKLTSTSWGLVTYIDLQWHVSEYQQLLVQYNATTQLCTSILTFKNSESSQICDMFLQQLNRATLTHLYEIEANFRSLMLAIGYHPHDRTRRGLRNTIGRMANVLYGVCSKVDTTFLMDKIIEIGKSKLESLNLIKEKKRILKVDSTAESRVLKQITEHQQKIDQNLKYFQQLVINNTQTINQIELKTKLLEQAFLIEMTLNKFAYETQSLISIVNAALDGKVHTNVLSSQQLLRELREVKMSIPAGSALPVEIQAKSLTELFRVAELSVFIQDNHLVYVIEIPLVLNTEYNVYRPIPFPIQLNSDTLVLIAPEVDYLAISADNEKFLTLTTENWGKCRTLQRNKLCKMNEPIHLRLDSQLCEVSLLTSHQTFPNTCNLKLIKSYKPIWHRLSESNSWLFVTTPNSGIITCNNNAKTFKIKVEGMGRITLSPHCELHIGHSIFIPLHQNIQEENTDIIPRDEKNELLPLLAKRLIDVVPQNISGIDAIKDFIKLAQKAIEIGRLPRVSSEPLLNTKINYIILTIVLTFMFICISCIIIIRKTSVRMYNPDIPNDLTEGTKEDIKP